MAECSHPYITTWHNDDWTISMWACRDCRRRFYPACVECVSIGHRNIDHEATPLDEAKLARALHEANVDCDYSRKFDRKSCTTGDGPHSILAAAIAKAYREDAG